MSASSTKSVTYQLGTPATLIFITLLILKATGTVSWSWWWITSPLWIGPAIALGFIGAFFAILLLIAVVAVVVLLVAALIKALTD